MARMYGRLGWYGQCKCCCGSEGKRTIRSRETKQWQQDADEELNEMSLEDAPSRRIPDPNVDTAYARLRERIQFVRDAALRGERFEMVIPLSDDEKSLRDLRASILNAGNKPPEMIDVGDGEYDWADEDEWYIAAINHAWRDD